MIKRTTIMSIILMLTQASNAFGQRPGGNVSGKLSGNVYDADFNEPIEYANIVLYRHRDSTQVTGTITNPQGYFQLTDVKPGMYYVEISFMGFNTHIIKELNITTDNPEVYVGSISLEPSILAVEGTEVVSERPIMSYEIDKKVINVSRQLTTTSGSAVDVLENVPSVDVDIEGNVSLRGSENFTVLIDGRPTILDASDALQQIPASMIDNIEIITNPSARYDPEGISGVINVIMKKKRLQGISGIANMNAGLDNKYGGDFLVSYRTGIANVFFSANYRKFNFPGTSTIESMTFQNDTSSYVLSDGQSQRTWNPYGLRAGIDLELGMWDRLSLGGEYGAREMERAEDLDYDEWSEPGDSHNLYVSQEQGEFSHRFYSLTLDHMHHFLNKDHTLAVQATYSMRERNHASFNELLDTTGIITSGHQNEEEGPSMLAQLKLDYTLPVQDDFTFEAGAMAKLSRSEEEARTYEYDTATGDYEFMDEFSHTTEYTRDIYALYGMFSNTWHGLGFQGGLRSEYTYRLIQMVGEDEQFTLDRWNYFPTAHVSYRFSNGHQFMASYTRRIHRPRSWWLEPFITWSDAYNVHMGNPDLKPEYIDSYELGFQTLLGKSVFSLETYYRITHNNVERVQSVYSENVILHTVENVGTDRVFGVEGMFDIKFVSWWNINCTGNLFQQRIEGELDGEPFSEEDFNWRTNFSNEFKVLPGTKLQITGRYRSPSLSAQGQREGFFTTDAALKQEFFSKKLAMTLQVRDIFGTRKREHTSEGEDFYFHRYSERKSPVVMLSFNYNFNNYKQKRQRDDADQDFEEMEDLE
ncbi:TonB-dependent receptor [candidate division WOR-3 bacterium]|nr:TonB-dependent receptor [candidate division WOR-3 bacterium]